MPTLPNRIRHISPTPVHPDIKTVHPPAFPVTSSPVAVAMLIPEHRIHHSLLTPVSRQDIRTVRPRRLVAML